MAAPYTYKRHLKEENGSIKPVSESLNIFNKPKPESFGWTFSIDENIGDYSLAAPISLRENTHRISEGGSSDYLYGGAGRDLSISGNDKLYGGTSDDTLEGGQDGDIYHLTATDFAGSDKNTINDDGTEDRIFIDANG